MKRDRNYIVNYLNSLPESELKKMAYAFFRIKEHIWREFDDNNSEVRKREKIRLKIAQKHITQWFNEY